MLDIENLKKLSNENRKRIIKMIYKGKPIIQEVIISYRYLNCDI